MGFVVFSNPLEDSKKKEGARPNPNPNGNIFADSCEGRATYDVGFTVQANDIESKEAAYISSISHLRDVKSFFAHLSKNYRKRSVIVLGTQFPKNASPQTL